VDLPSHAGGAVELQQILMADAAHHSGNDPDRISFVAALRIARQSIAPGALFPPEDTTACDRVWQHAIAGSCTGSTRPADYARHPG